MSIDLVEGQQASGGHEGVGNVTLPNPTTAGNRVVMTVSATSTIATPAGFTKDSTVGGGSTAIYSKLAVDGETSWSLGAAGVVYEWDVFEYSGIDPDDPVDVIGTSAGSGGSTGTTPSSTTYDGRIIGAHGAINNANATVPTFGAHTTQEELSDHGRANGAGDRAVAISTCHRAVQSLGTWECDCDANIGSQVGVIVVYSAEGAKREPTVSHFWSFPAEMAGFAPVPSYFVTLTGSPVILAGGGLQLTGAANIQNATGPGISVAGVTGPAHVANIKFRLNSLSGDLVLATLVDSGGGSAVVRYVAASQKFGVQVGSGTEVLSDATVTTGVDYSIDLRNRRTPGGATTSRTVKWQIDYGSGPVEQTDATGTGSAALATLTPRLGWTAASTGQVTFWHAVYSNIAGHYPLTGRWVFPFLKPDTAGTITTRSGTTDDLRRFTANGTIAGSFNSADIIAALRDWPPVLGASADGAAIIAANTGTYAIPMETYDAAANGGSIRVVQVLGAFWAASTTTATITVRGHDGTNSKVLFSEADPGADNSSTPPWFSALWRPAAAGGVQPQWLQAMLDAATIDLISLDATPDIGLHCLGMIVAVRLADTVPVFGGTSVMRVESRSDPDSGGVLSLHTFTPSGQSVTLTYEVNGVPVVANSGNPIPGGSNPHIEIIDALDLPTVNRIELVPG